MAQGDAARTERELAALRSQVEADLALLRERVRSDLDVRRLARRRPLSVFGGLAAAGTLAATAVVRRLAAARRRRPTREIDDLIERLGGRVERMKRKSRERLRESIRKEIGEVELGRRVERAAWTAVTAGLAALAGAIAQGAARRFWREPRADRSEGTRT